MVVENCAWETLGWRGPVRQSEQADLRPHRLRRRHWDCPGKRENQRHSAREKHAAWGRERQVSWSVQGSGERREKYNLTLQGRLDPSDHRQDLRAPGLAGLLAEPPTLAGL